MIQEHRYDVVIVGAGGAGMRAAVEAGPRVRTAVLTKLYPTRSHTGAAQGGMCAALANVEEDNWEWHTFDTVKGGDYLADQDAVEIMCKEAIDAVLDLEKMGMPFNRTPEGRIDQRRFGGHTRDHGKAPVRRACYAADRTGHMILQTLYQNCVKHDVEFFNEFYALDLVLTETPRGPVATGVVAYELATGDIHVFHAKAIVLATGGSGRMYKTTSNAHTLTGDGLGIVFRKGLPLEDMEFHQFHPTGLAGLGILISEAVRGEGGRLLNGEGERFMERYAPTIVDLAPRDIVARSMVLEVLEGRGAGPRKDYVYIDVRHLGEDVLEAKLPDITEFSRTYLGVDPVKELVPVYPTCHYVMGGIPTTLIGEVLRDNTHVVPGLYAAGECACVSVHGANRLGTNSLLDINVFGRRAGLAAAVQAARDGHQVELFEASRTLGGRARALACHLPDGTVATLDNGQHILIGAYTDTLALMREVGVDPEAALLRMPLSMQFADGSGLACPRWPSPWDALAGILRARGWLWGERLSMLGAALRWQLRNFQCGAATTVADLTQGLSPRVRQELIDPLCVSALNTPSHRASGQVFLRVLKDALFGIQGGSNLLLPKVDLSALFPAAAAAWLERRGVAIHLGSRIEVLQGEALSPDQPAGCWRLSGKVFDAVVLATSAPDAARALANSDWNASKSIASPVADWCSSAQALPRPESR